MHHVLRTQVLGCAVSADSWVPQSWEKPGLVVLESEPPSFVRPRLRSTFMNPAGTHGIVAHGKTPGGLAVPEEGLVEVPTQASAGKTPPPDLNAVPTHPDIWDGGIRNQIGHQEGCFVSKRPRLDGSSGRLAAAPVRLGPWRWISARRRCVDGPSGLLFVLFLYHLHGADACCRWGTGRHDA